MTEGQRRILQAMDIDVWLPRRMNAPEVSPAMASVTPGLATTEAVTPETVTPETVTPEISARASPAEASSTEGSEWSALKSAVSQCTQCSLHRTRTQTVFGVGDPDAQWMIVGEAPGADEDRQGEPFVGRAGQLLNEMLYAVGLSRERVYIANILKCRPPSNRDPHADEVASCLEYLHRQVAMVQPRLIVAVGRIAAQNLLDEDQPVGRLRGRLHSFGASKVPVVVTYHPAYLLRSPGQKRKAWEDLCLARSIVEAART